MSQCYCPVCYRNVILLLSVFLSFMVWLLFWYSGNIHHNSWTVFLKLSFPYVLMKWTAMRSIALLIYFIFNTLVFSMLLCFNTLIFLCCFVLGWVPFLLSSSISNLNCHTLHHKHLNTDLWPSLSYSIYIGNSYRIYIVWEYLFARLIFHHESAVFCQNLCH